MDWVKSIYKGFVSGEREGIRGSPMGGHLFFFFDYLRSVSYMYTYSYPRLVKHIMYHEPRYEELVEVTRLLSFSDS